MNVGMCVYGLCANMNMAEDSKNKQTKYVIRKPFHWVSAYAPSMFMSKIVLDFAYVLRFIRFSLTWLAIKC